ncbi:hypothetical protein [Spirosoma aerophilum]
MNASIREVCLPNYFHRLSFSVKDSADGASYRLPNQLIGKVWFFTATLLILSNLSWAQTPAPNTLTLVNLVNKSIANQGDVLTHTLVLTNTGAASVTAILVQDSTSTGLQYVSNSASAPGGTTFTAGIPISSWSIPSLAAGQSLSLTYQTVADSSGILYSQASVPGDTATACTSIPLKVCEGDTYAIQLTGPAGRSSYRWFRDGVELTDQTTRVLTVSSPGSYSLSVDDVSGKCPDFSCCPFIVEQYALPDFQATTVSASCPDMPPANGKIILSGFNPADTYQYSEGNDFNPTASLSGAPKMIPADGVLADNLVNPATSQAYTIRVYNASGCYIERTVTLLPAVCCSLTATALSGPCAGATNTFSNTVVVTLAHAVTGTLIITDGPSSQTVAVTTASTTFTAVFNNLPANGSTHAVTASLPGCSSTTASYVAPIGCLPDLAVSVTRGDCEPSTNTYSISGSLSLTNAITDTATITDGVVSTTVPINAGETSVAYSLTGLSSGTDSHTVVVSYAGQAVSSNYTAPVSCTVAPTAPAPALTPTITLSVTDPGVCEPATNLYTTTGTLTLTNAPSGTAIITDGLATTALSVSAGTTSVIYSLTGLLSGSGLHTVTVNFASLTASTTYTAPVSCTQSIPVMLSLEQRVDKSRTNIGEINSYTLVLTNTGTTTASGVPVQLLNTPGLTYIPASVTLPSGTTFTPGNPGSVWIIASISSGQSLSLTFQARADSSGILYNTAIISGDTARVCTSVPVKVCPGSGYSYRLAVASGHSRYQWFRTVNGITSELTSFTTNILDVTQPGEYKLIIDNSTGTCTNFSCCPFILEEDTLPTFQATVIPVACVGGTPQANGKIELKGVKPTYTFQYSAGTSFTPTAVLSGSAKAIPADGLIVSDLPNPTLAQAYTIRVYNESGCYADTSVVLLPVACTCPENQCIPFVFKQTKRVARIGDAK